MEHIDTDELSLYVSVMITDVISNVITDSNTIFKQYRPPPIKTYQYKYLKKNSSDICLYLKNSVESSPVKSCPASMTKATRSISTPDLESLSEGKFNRIKPFNDRTRSLDIDFPEFGIEKIKDDNGLRISNTNSKISLKDSTTSFFP